MTDDDAFNRFVFDDAKLAGYTQAPPLSLAEMTAAIESLKRRLVVPAERVEEFETAVRTAGLDDRVTVVGHPWLKPDQVFLMQSEAVFEVDMRASIEAGQREMLERMREETAAALAELREELEAEARQEREREYLRAVYSMQRPFRGLLGLGSVDV